MHGIDEGESCHRKENEGHDSIHLALKSNSRNSPQLETWVSIVLQIALARALDQELQSLMSMWNILVTSMRSLDQGVLGREMKQAMYTLSEGSKQAPVSVASCQM